MKAGTPVRTLLIVPGLFGTEIVDAERGPIWGPFSCLYRGPLIGELPAPRGRAGRVMTGINLGPLVLYDIIGSLLKALQRAGYQQGKNLFIFGYDWRQRVIESGAPLAAEIRRLAEAAGGTIDLLGLSNGGLTIRAAYATDRSLPVETVVLSGAPLAGSIETLTVLHHGFQFAPMGRTVSPEEFVACPGSMDSIPSPRTAMFMDVDGDNDHELYDIGTWRRLRLSVLRNDPDALDWTRAVEQRLAALSETWRILETAGAPKRLVCVCGHGLPTQRRIVVENGRVRLPGEGNLRGLPAEAIAEGDGTVTLESARAWTGAYPQLIRIPVTRHRDVVRAPQAFTAILSALK
jgi:pimeloyl-ACP methyl ester carboxylesterase